MERISGGKAKLRRTGRSGIKRYGTKVYKNDFVSNAIPEHFQFLFDRLKPEFDFDHLTVNEYQAGRGISAHFDSKLSGETIVVLSLLSEAEMKLAHKGHEEVYKLNPRSLLSMSGDARWKYTHEILPVKSLRYSLVFRKLTE